MINQTLYELEELQACFEAVSDLLCPEPNLQAQQMDRLSLLLGYLNRQREALMDQLRAEVLKNPTLKAVA
ncbi:MAG: hypothetical protein P9F19_01520 [Candidatus Contendobacter sp.]|nr:hypothetical protein [Candidatus Contendobacter sp.]MDG4556069.1 hypothetical protein [Candidatus Contendobacter sp.]